MLSSDNIQRRPLILSRRWILSAFIMSESNSIDEVFANGVLLMRTIVFELCAENIESCLVAREGGANRIELCSALSEGGLTPSHGLIREAVNRSGLPVHVLLRPRCGDFVYSQSEFDVMVEDLQHARALGAAGVVLGILRSDNTVDVERTRDLVSLAGPIEVTFNRAFDHTASLELALEDLVAVGCKRILTSGGEQDVVGGQEALARLVKQAAGRIDIAVGGGLTLKNASAVSQSTGAQHFHGSLRRVGTNLLLEEPTDAPATQSLFTKSRPVVDASDVRSMIENLVGS